MRRIFIDIQQLVPKILLFTFLYLFVMVDSFAQDNRLKVSGGKGVKVGDLFIIKGNCRVENDGVITTFDQCEQPIKGTTTTATGNIHTKAKGLDIKSDKLIIDNMGVFKYRTNVVLTTEEGKTLTTSHLDYFQAQSKGHFYNGGKVVDSISTLISKEGFFYPKKNEYMFIDSVVATNEEHILYTDTLTYNLLNKTAKIHGPTNIISDSTTAFCKKGWYNMEKDFGYMGKDAVIINGHYILKGDSLIYDKFNGIAEGFNDVQLSDTSQNIIISGRYSKYFLDKDKGLVTDSALLFQYTKTDSLYMHADTLSTEYDTSGTYQIIKAYKRAIMFRSDLQSRSDSMVYTLNDSIIRIYKKPVLWSPPNQITAETIEVLTKNNRPYQLEMKNNAFVISKETEYFFNQIKGKSMTGYIVKGALERMIVNESPETIYFPVDGGRYIGVNKLNADLMTIRFRKNKIRDIGMKGKCNGTLSPIKTNTEGLKLNRFVWLEKFRPLKVSDIYFWNAIDWEQEEALSK